MTMIQAMAITQVMMIGLMFSAVTLLVHAMTVAITNIVCVLEALEVQYYEWEVEELYANDSDSTFATSAVMSCL